MTTEFVLRTIGGVLQAAGVGFVGYELHAAIARYRGEPNVLARLRVTLARMRLWIVRQYRRITGKALGQSIQVTAASSIGITGTAKAMALTGAREHGTFDADPERVRYLFDRVESAFTRIDGLEDRVTETGQQCRKRHEDLQQQVQETNKSITKTAQAIEAGSVRLRTTGFVCVLSGIVLTTWPLELARMELGPALVQLGVWSGLAFAWTRQPSSGS